MNFTTQYGENRHTDIANFATLIHKKKLIHSVAIFTILYGNYCPPHEEFKLICIGKFARRTSLNSMGKIAKGVNKINFTMLYGNYCYSFVENFPQKFSSCTLNCMKSDIQTQLKKILLYSSALQCKKVQSSIEKFYWLKKLRKIENFSFNLNIKVPFESVNLFLHVFLCLKVILTMEHYIKLLTIFM